MLSCVRPPRRFCRPALRFATPFPLRQGIGERGVRKTRERYTQSDDQPRSKRIHRRGRTGKGEVRREQEAHPDGTPSRYACTTQEDLRRVPKEERRR